jgi:hypothetical protein
LVSRQAKPSLGYSRRSQDRSHAGAPGEYRSEGLSAYVASHYCKQFNQTGLESPGRLFRYPVGWKILAALLGEMKKSIGELEFKRIEAEKKGNYWRIGCLGVSRYSVTAHSSEYRNLPLFPIQSSI